MQLFRYLSLLQFLLMVLAALGISTAAHALYLAVSTRFAGGGLRERLAATFSRGEFFGEIAFLDLGHRTANAEAATDTELFVLSRGALDVLAVNHERATAAAGEAREERSSDPRRLIDRREERTAERPRGGHWRVDDACEARWSRGCSRFGHSRRTR